MGVALEFFDKLYKYCDESGLLEIRMLPKEDNVDSQIFAKTYTAADTLVDKLASLKNIYFGVGLRKSRGGTKEHVGQIPCVWVDMDAKLFGNSKAEAKRRLWKDAPLQVGNWSIINDSGGGYHAYLLLKEPATTPEEFLKIEAINRGLARSINADPAVFDIARILRVPGTFNLKYDPRRDVKMVFSSDNEVDISELEMYEEIGMQVPHSSVCNYDKNILTEDIQRMVDNCGFMQWCIANAKDLPEPAWYAMISNMASFRGSPGFIHEISKPYKGYTPRETNEKILHALNDSAPISCAKVKAEIFDCGRTCGVKAPAGLPYKTWTAVIEEGENPFLQRDIVRKQLVEASIPEKGFVSQYIEYASSLTDAPKIFHLFCALSLLASVVERNAWVPGFGGRELFPNLWVTIVAPSSAYRKSTAINIAQDFMNEVGLSILPEEFSREVLIQQLVDHAQSTFVWPEFGAVLGNFGREYMSGVKDLLAHLYDCPKEYTRKLTDKEFTLEGPCLNILGGTNIDWMLDKNVKEDLRGGFLARMIFIPHTSKDFELDTPMEPDNLFRMRLVGFLKNLRDYGPAEFKVDHLESMRRELKFELNEIARNSEYITELQAAFTRYQVIALKIALLFAIAEGEWGGEIPKHCFLQASNVVKLLKESIIDILRSIPMSRDDKVIAEVTNKIEMLHSSGLLWIPRGRITQYTHKKKSTLDPIIDTMVEMGRLRVRQNTEGGGKPKTEYQLVLNYG